MSQSLTREQWQIKKMIRKVGREWWMMNYCAWLIIAGFFATFAMIALFVWLWGSKHPQTWPWLITTGEYLFGILTVICFAVFIGTIHSTISHYRAAKTAWRSLVETVTKIVVIDIDNWPKNGTVVHPRSRTGKPFRLDWLPDYKGHEFHDAVCSLRRDEAQLDYSKRWYPPEKTNSPA